MNDFFRQREISGQKKLNKIAKGRRRQALAKVVGALAALAFVLLSMSVTHAAFPLPS